MAFCATANEKYAEGASMPPVGTEQKPLTHCASAPHGAPFAETPLGGKQGAASIAAHTSAADS